MKKLGGLLCVFFLVLGVWATANAHEFSDTNWESWGFWPATNFEHAWTFDLRGWDGIKDRDSIPWGSLVDNWMDVDKVWNWGSITNNVTFEDWFTGDYHLAVRINEHFGDWFWGNYSCPNNHVAVPDASIMFLLGPSLLVLGLLARRKPVK